MNISTDINPSEEEITEISAILGCTSAELNNRLNSYIGAALKEYLTMFRGQKVLKRGNDILEYRLFLLIEYAFGGLIPEEQQVCNLFQTTLSESRSLIRAVTSKYQYQLRNSLEKTMQQTLTHATKPDGDQDYSVVINSHNIVDELNRLLAQIDGTLPSIVKKRGSVSTYEIKPSSYDRLNSKLNP